MKLYHLFWQSGTISMECPLFNKEALLLFVRWNFHKFMRTHCKCTWPRFLFVYIFNRFLLFPRYSYCTEVSWQLRMFDQRTNFYNASFAGIFDSELHESNDFGRFFTKTATACILGTNCQQKIQDKYDMYLTSGNANRWLGERKDEFSLRFDVIDVNQCYR